MFNKVLGWLYHPISATSISVFRILFGIIMLLEMIYFWKIDMVPFGLTRPVFHLKYDYFEWVEPLPEPIMYGILTLMTLASVLVLFGLWYKIAMAIFSFGFTYFFLIEQSHYNNHFYLFILLSFFMIFIDADRKYAIQSSKYADNFVPRWHQYLPTFFIFITYFFGGIAKLSPDWISGALPSELVQNLSNSSALKSFLGADLLVFLLQYGGIAFDLLIGFILLYKPTRWLGVLGVIIFNFTNGTILFDDIGNFPLFMVFATVLFFPSSYFDKLLAYDEPKSKHPRKKKSYLNPSQKNSQNRQLALQINKTDFTAWQKTIGSFVILTVIVQLLLPFRYHIFNSKYPEWGGENIRFSWRMKMQTKSVENLVLRYRDIQTNQTLEFDYKSYLTGNQLVHLVEDPNYLVQLARFMKYEAIRDRDVSNLIVESDIKVGLNGRKPQLYIDPKVDLSSIDPRDGTTDWIMPLIK